ncbi:MAG TPA: rhomboid family intramembrane serine protease [Rubricoccaceae bacterium]|nr:rhomboid family intramembrane serine protease [Rubricoccaceae bacterium]
MIYAAPATFLLLVLNVLVAVYTLVVDPSVLERWAFRPARVAREREWGRWITAGFVHVGLAHLAFNMITLFFFGPFIERQLGSWRFLVLYFGAELAANALTYWRHRDNPQYSAAGASGAIAGIVFAFVLFRPWEPIYLFFIPVGIPAVIFAGLYVALSIYASQQGGGRVAHEAHLGGALGGVALTVLLYPAALGIFLRQLGL